MTMDPDPTADTIVEETTINAPAERVFEAFADPAERVRWWASKDAFGPPTLTPICGRAADERCGVSERTDVPSS
jgi:uncharacterized protein YndB with AHSA1/START domain